MRCIILGAGKSGTTALFYAIRNGHPVSWHTIFEPKEIRSGVALAKDKEDVLVKWLFGVCSAEDEEALTFFDKRILIVRDPRDVLLSRLLYRTRGLKFSADDQKLEIFLSRLRQKERDPASVSVQELYDLQIKLEGGIGHASPRQTRGALKVVLDFWTKHKGSTFLLKYEDFVTGNLAALSEHLGFEVPAVVKVDRRHARVARSKRSGEWKDWFTPHDCKEYREICDSFICAFGYSQNWDLTSRPKLAPEHGSLYVQRIVKEKRAKMRLSAR